MVAYCSRHPWVVGVQHRHPSEAVATMEPLKKRRHLAAVAVVHPCPAVVAGTMVPQPLMAGTEEHLMVAYCSRHPLVVAGVQHRHPSEAVATMELPK